MARISTIITLGLVAILVLQDNPSSKGEPTQTELEPSSELEPQPISLTAQEEGLVDLAVGRFELQGLELPDIDYLFHPDLRPCNGHKGMYHKSTRTLEMCSMDLHTLLHELAHAWANENLTEASREEFVTSRGLDSWNDHDHAWERRGTEHVAETIAWALTDDPNHVKWVETGPDGSTNSSHRILSIGVDVETLIDSFKDITGIEPVFRDPSQWGDSDDASATSPELARLGG